MGCFREGFEVAEKKSRSIDVVPMPVELIPAEVLSASR